MLAWCKTRKFLFSPAVLVFDRCFHSSNIVYHQKRFSVFDCGCIWYAFVCSYVYEHKYAYRCMGKVHVHALQMLVGSEDKVRCLFPLFFTSYIEVEYSLELRALCLGWSSCQLAHWILLLPPDNWITSGLMPTQHFLGCRRCKCPASHCVKPVFYTEPFLSPRNFSF